MKAHNWKSWLLASSILGIAAPLPALAQGADDPTTIVVTARRTEERLQDVPISITVFNQQQLSNRNVVNSQDLATYTPSLSANSNFGSQNSSFAIRGFAQDIGTAPSVGVYFADVVAPRGAANGIPTGDGAGPGSFFDLANVQVLKGPQGTLFGRNTTGGAVILVPQKPTGRFEGYVEGSIGNYDMKRVQAVVNIPVMDTLRIRLGIDRNTRDGFLNNISGVGPKDFGDVDYTAVRASIVADLTPNLENYTIISYANSKTNGTVNRLMAAAPAGLGSFFFPQLARQGDNLYNVEQALANPYSKLEQWQIINTSTWLASDTFTVKNIVSYAQLKNNQNSPLFGVNVPLALGPLGTYNVPFTSVTSIPTGDTANQSTFTEELQLQGRSSDGRLTWQAGGYLEISNPLGDQGSQSPFLAACTNSATFQCTDVLRTVTALGLGLPVAFIPSIGSVNYTAGRTTFRNVGTYAQASYKITDQIKLTGGLRYTWDKQTNVSDQRTYILNPAPGSGPVTAVPPSATNPTGANPRCTNPLATATNCVSNYIQKSDKPTWLIGVDFTPTEDILLYAKYARGYRAGTIAPNITAPFNLVAPEKVDSYEAGFKTSFHGAVAGTLNVAAFYNDFSNQQLQLGFNAQSGSGQASTAAPVNAGKSEIWGFEVDGSLRPFEGLTIEGGYTYLRTKIKEVRDFSSFVDPNFVLSAPFRVGDPEVLAPRNKYTISATYTLPLDESVGKISFGAIFTHRDSMLTNYSSRANPNPSIAALSYLPPLDLLNLNASWNSIAGSPVDLTLFATNVTKQKYLNFVSGTGGSTQTNFETGSVGEPRMYGLRVRVRFGS
ncbi:MAG: TonB-dependent receptor [Sphingobium sp.]